MLFFLPGSIIAVVFLVVCYYCYTIAFYAPPRTGESISTDMTGPQYEKVSGKIRAAIDKMTALPFEEIYVTSFDGLKLFGRYYHQRDHAPIMILFHGYRSFSARDCCGGLALARKLGFNVLAVDQRAHGNSEGNTISFGILERRDCKTWADTMVSRFGQNVPIVLSGLSMGAATVLMAADLNLPENVVAILADSPYSAPKAIISKVCKDMHLPTWLAWPFVRCAARIYGKFSIESVSAQDAVCHSSVPILILHGEDDRFVPCSMSRDIFKNCPEHVTLRTFPDAGHGLCYVTDKERYERYIEDFLRSIPALVPHLST